MNQSKGQWLLEKLAQNGFTLEDLASQTGLPLDELKHISKDETGTKEQWDVILSVLNEYPALYVPADTVISDLRSMTDGGLGDEMVIVYYGVNQQSLIFACYLNPADQSMHGANVSTQYLRTINISASQALGLFEAQAAMLSNIEEQ